MSKLSTHDMQLKTHLVLNELAELELSSRFYITKAPDTFYKTSFQQGTMSQFPDTIININLQNSFADIVDREQNTVLNTLNPHSPSAAYLELLGREDVVILCWCVQFYIDTCCIWVEL